MPENSSQNLISIVDSMQELQDRLRTLTNELETEKGVLDGLKRDLDAKKTESDQIVTDANAAISAAETAINSNDSGGLSTAIATLTAKKAALDTAQTEMTEIVTNLEASSNRLNTIKGRTDVLLNDTSLIELRTRNLEPDIFADGSTKGFWQFNNTTTPGKSGINGSYDAMSRFYAGFSDNNRELNTHLGVTFPHYGMKVNLPATPFEHVPSLNAENIAIYKGLSQCDNTTSEQEWNPNRRLFSAARKPAIQDSENWSLSFNYNTACPGMDFMSIKNHFYQTEVRYVTSSGDTTKKLTDFTLHEQMFFTSRKINTGADAIGMSSPFKDNNTHPVLRIRLDAGFFNTYNGARINAPYAGTNYKDINLDGKDNVFGGITPVAAFELKPVIDYVQSVGGNPMGAVSITTSKDFAIHKLRGQNIDDPGSYYTYINAYIKKDAEGSNWINYTWTFDTRTGHIAAHVDGVKKLEFHIEIKNARTPGITVYKPYFYNSMFAGMTQDFIPTVTARPADMGAAGTLVPANVIQSYVNNLPREEDNDWYQDKLIFFRFPYSVNINDYNVPMLKDVRVLNKIVNDIEIKSLASETLDTNYDININREQRIIYNIKPNIFRDGSDIAYAKFGQQPIIAKNWFSVAPAEAATDVVKGYIEKQPQTITVNSESAKSDFTHCQYPEATNYTISFVVDKNFAPQSATALLVGMLGYSVADDSAVSSQFETWQGKEYPVYSVPQSAKADKFFELRYNNAVVSGMTYNTTDVNFNNCISFPTGSFRTSTSTEYGKILCAISFATGVDSVSIVNKTLRVFSPAVIGALYQPASFVYTNKTEFALAGENNKLSLSDMSRSITGGGSTFIRPASLTTVFRHDNAVFNAIKNILPDTFDRLSVPNSGIQFDNTTNSVKNMTLTPDSKKTQLFGYQVANSGTTPTADHNVSNIHLTTSTYTNAILNPANTIYIPVYDNDANKVRVTIVSTTVGDVQTIKAYVGTEIRDSVVIGGQNTENSDDYNGTMNNKFVLRLLPHKFSTEIFGATTPYESVTNHSKPFGPQGSSQFFYNSNLENNQQDNGLGVNRIYEVSIFNRSLTIDDIDVLVASDRKDPGELIYDVQLPPESPIITSADVDIDGNPSYRGIEESEIQPAPAPATPVTEDDTREYNPGEEGSNPQPQEPEQPQQEEPTTGNFEIKYKDGMPYSSGTPVDVTSLTAGKKVRLSNVDLYFSVQNSETKRYSMILEHIDQVTVDLSIIKQSGVYYLKRTQASTTWQLTNGRPVVGKQQTTGDYYLNGDWYNKNGQKLEPTTYIPYHIVVDGVNIKFVQYDLYSGLDDSAVTVTALPEGEWYTMDSQRDWGMIYTNTTKHTMMVVVAGDRGETITAQVTRSNSIEAYTLKNEETLMFLVEPNERYKVSNQSGLTKKWQEFKRV